MAQESLRRVSSEMQPVKTYVKGCMRSARKYDVFCLVEAPFDMRIYTNKLSDRIDVRVACADDAKLSHSRTTVEQFVRELRTEFPHGHIIGIRDVDYSEYINHSMPTGVLGTDDRDLEMTILHSPSFTAFLSAAIPDYVNVMRNCFDACRCLGYIRIYDEYIGRKCQINKKVKISNVYDSQQHQYKVSYKDSLKLMYISYCSMSVAKEDIDDYIEENHLDEEDDYRVCRGHDLLSLLGIVLGNKFHEPVMHNQMELHYSKEDFYHTNLFQDIQNYCSAFNIEAKKE